MWIARKSSNLLEKKIRQFPVLLITGPRQIGKTSLLKYLFPEYHYLNFDSPTFARAAADHPEGFLEDFQEPLILDEIQYAPQLFRSIKVKVDAHPHKKGRFLLTGSQNFSLMQKVTESLAGRCGILEMNSLSYEEVLSAKPKFIEIDYMVRGGFPALYSNRLFKNASEWYSSYLATYLERDLRNLQQVGNLRDFERFLRAVALRSGQILSYSDLARDVGIAPNTAKQWISLLVTSGIIYLLEPYHRSLGKRLSKSPKIYFLDVGLACYLIGIETVEELKRSPLIGAYWETFVIGQLVRYFQNQGKRPSLWFWRTSYGEEVDVLIEKGGRFIALECKWNEMPDESALKGFRSLKNFYGDESMIKGMVICRTPHSFPLTLGKEKVWAISVKDLERIED